MEGALRDHLFELADAFGAATKVSRRTIAKRALNDNTFFVRIESGDGFNVRTFDRLVSWFSANWPNGVAWPEDIERVPPHASTERAEQEAGVAA